MVNIIIAVIIFGYAGWAVYSHVKKGRKGKCSACDIKGRVRSVREHRNEPGDKRYEMNRRTMTRHCPFNV